jgi:hypothetical protein
VSEDISWSDDFQGTPKEAYARGLNDAVRLIVQSYSLSVPEGAHKISYQSGMHDAFGKAIRVISNAEGKVYRNE